MQQDAADLVFPEEQHELDRYEEKELQRVSQLARQSYSELQGMTESEEIGYQDRLHLEVQVEQTREIIYQCNLELTDFLVTHSACILPQRVQQEPEEEIMSSSEKSEPDVDWLDLLSPSLQNFKKTLTLREVQLTMALFVMEHNNSKDFKTLYLKLYGPLAPYIIAPELTDKPINIYILQDLFHREHEFLRNYLTEIANLKKFGDLSGSSYFASRAQVEAIVGRMKVSHSKIKTISEIFPYACVKDGNDLFSFSPSHPRWQQLTSSGRLRLIALADHQTLAHSFQDLKNNITKVNAAMSVLDRYRSSSSSQPLTKQVMQLATTAVQVLRMALFKTQAHHEATVMMAEPEEALAKEIWNLPQNKKFRQFVDLSLPSIQYSEVFYLPRQFKQYFAKRYWSQSQEQVPDLLVDELQEYLKNLTQKQDYENTIRVRVNAPFNLMKRQSLLNQQQPVQNESKGLFSVFTKMFHKQAKAPRALIFHIHGGGFISMSSFIHQTYTRPWASHLSVPIISVDYGKAPNHPFPQGLYDCFEAYLWTLLVFKQVYRLYPEKIVIVGDSAGGNLAAALTTLLIQWKLPLPTGIVLVYPALNLNLNDYTPSQLTALNDMILPHTFLKLCQKAYIRDERLKPDQDPFISPILTPDSVLASYPKTQIFVGNKDPFHDDCCRLLERMNIAKPDNANLTVLEEFPHGFLQFDLRLLPNEYSREATRRVEQALGSLLGQ